MNMREVGMRLSEVSEALSSLTEDRITREQLRANARRLGLGALRLVVLGNSNAGKSTLINALMRTIAVPESGNTSSPIPVWFASGGENVRYSVYSRAADGTEQCSYPDGETFIRQYCYSLMDITDDKRQRFVDTLWASAEVPSSYLRETGYTLIDTLGVNATDADTAKTIATIDSGMDAALFVTSRVSLLASDIKFLRERVLGLDARLVPYPIHPSRLLLVYNDKGMAGATLQLLHNSVDQLLAGLPQDVIDSFKRNNIVMLNALAARRVRCGAYDYARFAPQGTLEMEMQGLKNKTALEEQAVAARAPQMVEAARSFDALEQKLTDLARRMMTEPGGVVEKRIMKLEAEIDAIRVQRNVSIGELQKQQADVQQQMNAIRNLNMAFMEANREVSGVYDHQRSEMRSAIQKTLKASRETQNALVGGLYGLGVPEGLVNKETMQAFQEATLLQKQETLSGWLREILQKHFLPDASRQFKKLLLEASVKAGDPTFTERDTVRYQVEAARRLTALQSVNMRSFCQQVDDQGAKDIGLIVPTEEIISEWFNSMASEMESAILEAIALLQPEADKKLNEQLPKIAMSIKVNGIIERILQFFGSVEGFWKAIRERAVIPAAKVVCSEWFKADFDSEVNMYQGIDQAYARVQQRVMDSLNALTAQVDAYLSKLAALLAGQQADTQAAQADSAQVMKRLDGMQARLDQLRTEMIAQEAHERS